LFNVVISIPETMFWTFGYWYWVPGWNVPFAR